MNLRASSKPTLRIPEQEKGKNYESVAFEIKILSLGVLQIKKLNVPHKIGYHKKSLDRFKSHIILKQFQL